MKFWIEFYELDFFRKQFRGRVKINSSHLKRLVELLPEGAEVQNRAFFYKRVGDELYISGAIRCTLSHCCDPQRFKTLGCPWFTKCELTRATQSLFTYLKHLSDSVPSSEAQTSEAKEAESSSSAERQDQEIGLNSSGCKTEDEGQNPDLSSRQEGQSLSEAVSSADSGSEEAEGGPGGEDQETPPESAVDSGNFGDGVSSHPEVECQSKTSGADEAGGSPASAVPFEGDNLLQGEQGKERAGESDKLSLDSCPAGALSGQEGSCIETGQDPSTSSEESGSLWEMSFNPEESQHSYGGGGGQAKALSAEDSNSKIEKQVALLLRRLFSSIEDIFKKQEGRDFWDARRVIYSSTLAPQNLPDSKSSRPSFRKISLWVDVSGSVSHLTDFIISMIIAASRDKDVQVVIGSEAHPQKILPDSFHKLNEDWWEAEPVWEREYIRHFENQAEIFLRENKLEQGSLIAIWSDYMDIHASDLSKLARLFKPYKVVWLCSHDQSYDADYEGNESFKLEKFARKQGHLFLWGVDSPEGIRKAIKYLSVKKK